jgi:thioredoxin 1
MRQMLYFTAPWCRPCQQLGPIIDEISNANPNRIKKVNVDYDPELPQRYNIKSIPTTIILKNGQEVERKVGVQPKSYYLQALQLN